MYRDYENPFLRGTEEARPWRIQQEIYPLLHSSFKVLDVGCGSLFKWENLKDSVNSLTGLERNGNMIGNAKINLDKWQDPKVTLVQGDSQYLPFKSHCFDMVTAIMTPCYCEEIIRVLKPGGVFVLETSTEMDQRNIKLLFEKDDKGWRGAKCEFQEGALVSQWQGIAKKAFSHYRIKVGRWKTRYSLEQLDFLLTQVPRAYASIWNY